MKKTSSHFWAFFLSTAFVFGAGLVGVFFLGNSSEIFGNKKNPVGIQNIVSSNVDVNTEENEVSGRDESTPLRKQDVKKLEIKIPENFSVGAPVYRTQEKSSEKIAENDVSGRDKSTPLQNPEISEQQESIQALEEISEKILSLDDGNDFFPNYEKKVEPEILEYKKIVEDQKNLVGVPLVGTQNAGNSFQKGQAQGTAPTKFF